MTGWGRRSAGAQCRACNSRILKTDAGQIGDRELILARSSRLRTRDELADFSMDATGAEQPGVDGVFELAEGGTLAGAIGDDEIGAGETRGFQFLFSRCIGSHGG